MFFITQPQFMYVDHIQTTHSEVRFYMRVSGCMLFWKQRTNQENFMGDYCLISISQTNYHEFYWILEFNKKLEYFQFLGPNIQKQLPMGKHSHYGKIMTSLSFLL